MELTNLQFNHAIWPYVIVVLCCLSVLLNIYAVCAFCKRRWSHPLRGILQALLVEDAALCGFLAATLIIMVLMRLGYGEGDSLLPYQTDKTLERYFRDLESILHPDNSNSSNLTTTLSGDGNSTTAFPDLPSNITFDLPANITDPPVPNAPTNTTEVIVDLLSFNSSANWSEIEPMGAATDTPPIAITTVESNASMEEGATVMTSSSSGEASGVGGTTVGGAPEEATPFSVLQQASDVQYDWLRYFYFAIRIQHMSVIWLILPLSYFAVARQPHYGCILLALVLVKLLAALYNVVRVFEIGVAEGADRTFIFYRRVSWVFDSAGYDIAYTVGGFWVWHLFLPIILLLGSWIGFCLRWPGTCQGTTADVRRMTVFVQLLFLATHIPFFVLWILYDDYVLEKSLGGAAFYRNDIAWICNLLVVLNSIAKPVVFLAVSKRWRQSCFGCYCKYCCCCCCTCCRKFSDSSSGSPATINSPGGYGGGGEAHEVHDLLPKDID